mgnify:CR=1 FL=1|tara:strand:- start:14 stop:400 length:387 start_codon:yes stop_codon:yes gene_type:complete
MKLFTKMKDGGKDSTVTGYWLIECKSLFSICVLKFEGVSREAYHNHAFHSISWVISGQLVELMLDNRIFTYKPSIFPILTSRKDMHQVSSSTGNTWVFTLRGPWNKTWCEFIPETDEYVTLSKGRVKL